MDPETRSFTHVGKLPLRGNKNEGLSSLMARCPFVVKLCNATEYSRFDKRMTMHVWTRPFHAPLPFSTNFAQTPIVVRPLHPAHTPADKLELVVGVRPLAECEFWMGEFGGRLVKLQSQFDELTRVALGAQSDLARLMQGIERGEVVGESKRAVLLKALNDLRAALAYKYALL